MKPRTLYFKLCDEVDQILIDSGIRDKCTRCSRKKTTYISNGKKYTIHGGCCNRCKHLSCHGCKIKSLGCKMWLCWERFDEFEKMIKSIGKAERFNEIIRIASKNNFFMFREGWPTISKTGYRTLYHPEYKTPKKYRKAHASMPTSKGEYGDFSGTIEELTI